VHIFSSVLNTLNSAICILQVLSKDNPPRKTYVYKLNVPVAAQWISVAVAPFEILLDRHSTCITHMCLSANMSKLQNTVEFFHSAFRFFILVM
jgi:transcription initiation factor TFIID subunit 2